LGVRPKCAPAALEDLNRPGSSIAGPTLSKTALAYARQALAPATRRAYGMLGRVAASQIASAASFFCRFTYGFT
jgi:hypothetical protein